MSRSSKKAKALLVSLLLGVLFASSRANAQTEQKVNSPTPQTKEVSADDGWHFAVTPYIWFAGMHGTAGALGHEASVHASFGDIASYLNIGAMGTFEARYNRVVIPVDFIWMKLSDEKGLPVNEVGVDSIKTTVNETVLTPKIGYRIVDGKKVKVDALFGFRYWHLGLDLKAVSQGSVIDTRSKSTDLVDGVAGGRIELALSPKAFVTFGGDAGGGSARSDWQVGGYLGYKLGPKWVLLGGYRYLSINYRPNNATQFVYNVNMPGLVLGATYNIK